MKKQWSISLPNGETYFAANLASAKSIAKKKWVEMRVAGYCCCDIFLWKKGHIYTYICHGSYFTRF